MIMHNVMYNVLMYMCLHMQLVHVFVHVVYTNYKQICTVYMYGHMAGHYLLTN